MLVMSPRIYVRGQVGSPQLDQGEGCGGRREAGLPSGHRPTPSPLDRLRSGRRERAAQLGLDAVAESSFEINQSFPKARRRHPKPASSISADNFLCDGPNDVSLSPGHCKGSFTAAAQQCELQEQSRDSWSFYNYIGGGVSGMVFPTTVRNPNKAICSIDADTSEILTANLMACQLFSFSQSELLGMELKALLRPKSHSPTALSEHYLEPDGTMLSLSGKVVEMEDSNGMKMLLSLWLQKLPMSGGLQRCLCVMEPVERTVATVVFDSKGKILGCDEQMAVIHGFSSHWEVTGLFMMQLIPSFRMPQEGQPLPQSVRKQQVTGRTRFGASFPLSMAVYPASNTQHLDLIDPELELDPDVSVYIGVEWVFANISGMLCFNPDGIIHSINPSFATIMFGYEHKELIGKEMTVLIPQFFDVLDLDNLSEENMNDVVEGSSPSVVDEESLGATPLSPDPSPSSPVCRCQGCVGGEGGHHDNEGSEDNSFLHHRELADEGDRGTGGVPCEDVICYQGKTSTPRLQSVYRSHAKLRLSGEMQRDSNGCACAKDRLRVRAVGSPQRRSRSPRKLYRITKDGLEQSTSDVQLDCSYDADVSGMLDSPGDRRPGSSHSSSSGPFVTSESAVSSPRRSAASASLLRTPEAVRSLPRVSASTPLPDPSGEVTAVPSFELAGKLSPFPRDVKGPSKIRTVPPRPSPGIKRDCHESPMEKSSSPALPSHPYSGALSREFRENDTSNPCSVDVDNEVTELQGSRMMLQKLQDKSRANMSTDNGSSSSMEGSFARFGEKVTSLLPLYSSRLFEEATIDLSLNRSSSFSRDGVDTPPSSSSSQSRRSTDSIDSRKSESAVEVSSIEEVAEIDEKHTAANPSEAPAVCGIDVDGGKMLQSAWPAKFPPKAVRAGVQSLKDLCQQSHACLIPPPSKSSSASSLKSLRDGELEKFGSSGTPAKEVPVPTESACSDSARATGDDKSEVSSSLPSLYHKMDTLSLGVVLDSNENRSSFPLKHQGSTTQTEDEQLCVVMKTHAPESVALGNVASGQQAGKNDVAVSEKEFLPTAAGAGISKRGESSIGTQGRPSSGASWALSSLTSMDSDGDGSKKSMRRKGMKTPERDALDEKSHQRKGQTTTVRSKDEEKEATRKGMCVLEERAATDCKTADREVHHFPYVGSKHADAGESAKKGKRSEGRQVERRPSSSASSSCVVYRWSLNGGTVEIVLKEKSKSSPPACHRDKDQNISKTSNSRGLASGPDKQAGAQLSCSAQTKASRTKDDFSNNSFNVDSSGWLGDRSRSVNDTADVDRTVPSLADKGETVRGDGAGDSLRMESNVWDSSERDSSSNVKSVFSKYQDHRHRGIRTSPLAQPSKAGQPDVSDKAPGRSCKQGREDDSRSTDEKFSHVSAEFSSSTKNASQEDKTVAGTSHVKAIPGASSPAEVEVSVCQSSDQEEELDEESQLDKSFLEDDGSEEGSAATTTTSENLQTADSSSGASEQEESSGRSDTNANSWHRQSHRRVTRRRNSEEKLSEFTEDDDYSGSVSSGSGITERSQTLATGTDEEEADEAGSERRARGDEPESFERCQAPAQFPEGSFVAQAQHSDGSLLSVLFEIKRVQLSAGDRSELYCMWMTRDPREPGKGSRFCGNLTLASSLSATDLSHSLSETSERQRQGSVEAELEEDVGDDDARTGAEEEEEDEDARIEVDPSDGLYGSEYETLNIIGKGAYGFVKLATQKSTGKTVVVKFIRKSKLPEDSYVLDETLGQVPLEVSLLSRLHHPNIVKMLAVFDNESFVQLVMEKHGSGMDLFEFIDRNPNLDEPLASYFFRQIVSAISYLHFLNILHRDIKDENIIVDENFHLKLIDFGAATFMVPGKLFGTFCGTLEYCSPEVLSGNRYRGPELEIWSLGVTLYTVVYGENPFYDVEETIKAVLKPPWEVSSSLLHLLCRMLHPDPASRAVLQEVEEHEWVWQPVDISQYSWSEVIPNNEFHGNTGADSRRSTSEQEFEVLEHHCDRQGYYIEPEPAETNHYRHSFSQ